MSRKRIEEDFDVGEFLRPTDSDLRSALRSLLGTDVYTRPGPELTPAIELSPGIELIPDVLLGPGPKIDLENTANSSIKLDPPLKSSSPVNLEAGIELGPGPMLGPVRKRNFAIREAMTANDGHSRAEEQVYRALWLQGAAETDGSRLIQIGFLALARLADLSESNARINLRSLIRKLAVEEHATYVCEQGQGRTWRVYSPELIVERRRSAGLRWFMKRTLAVVFVDPLNGDRLLD